MAIACLTFSSSLSTLLAMQSSLSKSLLQFFRNFRAQTIRFSSHSYSHAQEYCRLGGWGGALLRPAHFEHLYGKQAVGLTI